MLLQFALGDLEILILIDQPHLSIRQAQPQALESILGRRAVRELFFAILHGKEIEMVWVIKAAHA